MTLPKSNSLTFQELILKLQAFYAARGAVIQQPYDVEVGAGTMAPETFLRVLGPNPYKVAYVQPSRRPADGRYGENPNRLFKHLQLQVILKPPPENVQELYLESLAAIGIDLRQHDIKFEEDNWESPTLGAWGIGWQVMLDGLEVTQFTYFQQCGGVDLDPISAELTYGLERLCAFSAGCGFDLRHCLGARSRYGQGSEVWRSAAGRRAAVLRLQLRSRRCSQRLEAFRTLRGGVQAPDRPPTLHWIRVWVTDPVQKVDEVLTVIDKEVGHPISEQNKRFPLLGAYDLCLKCSHYFNILDARGAISVTERVGVIARVRALAVGIAKAWMDQQYPSEKKEGDQSVKPGAKEKKGKLQPVG